jgi:alpha-tubulin suppressor-like RCC1 family protein
MLRASPVAVTGGHTFVQLAAGGLGGIHSCGIEDTGQAFCWGRNNFGQLGDGSATQIPVTSPVAVADGHTFVQLAAGLFHSCGLEDTGQIFCWGLNANGQLGDGTTTNSSIPVLALPFPRRQ